ncbi:MAG: cytochrome [Acidobacteria bacterium]|nr:MAG: cytochrome [Acidobacteriota bacterium]
MSKTLVGVMGPGAGASADDIRAAYVLGQLIARADWVLVTGGRATGVMDAACRGARAEGGLTVGILPTDDARGMSAAVDIPILTGMGQARNNINVLSSVAVFACGMGAGTAAEIALAIKAGKPAILLNVAEAGQTFFAELGKGQVHLVNTPEEAVALAKRLITGA